MLKRCSLVEFKIYISLKHISQVIITSIVWQNSKFTYLSNNLNALIHYLLFGRIQNLHISQTASSISFLYFMFGRIQNLHISQTINLNFKRQSTFGRIQNLHISQTEVSPYLFANSFGRIQNLHISQTKVTYYLNIFCLVEFKIYISLKRY